MPSMQAHQVFLVFLSLALVLRCQASFVNGTQSKQPEHVPVDTDKLKEYEQSIASQVGTFFGVVQVHELASLMLRWEILRPRIREVEAKLKETKEAFTNAQTVLKGGPGVEAHIEALNSYSGLLNHDLVKNITEVATLRKEIKVQAKAIIGAMDAAKRILNYAVEGKY